MKRNFHSEEALFQVHSKWNQNEFPCTMFCPKPDENISSHSKEPQLEDKVINKRFLTSSEIRVTSICIDFQ